MYQFFIKTVLVLGVSAGIAGLVSYQHAYAATTPDSCFAFDSATGTITDYYEHEGNNPDSPTCTREVEIPADISGTPVTGIGDNAFYASEWPRARYKPLTSVTIPSTVTSIGSFAFYGNRLASITVPSSMTSMGDYAFNSNRLTSVTIEGDPTSLGSRVFNNNSIEMLMFNGTTYTASSPNDDSCYVFDAESGKITDFHQADLAFIKSNDQACLDRSITIPETIGGVPVTGVGNSAFGDLQLTSVIIPGSITSIGQGAFAGNQLTSVTIPNSITELPTSVFYSNQLTSLVIPNSVTTIGYNAFARNQLTSVVIPNSVTTLEGGAFSSNQLTSVTIPNSITTIDDTTFVFNRLTEVELPASIESVDVTAFAGQNTWGRSVEDSVDPAYDIYGGDLSVVQHVYDNMWYARLYTSNPSNPQSIPDGMMSEWWWTGDVNQNGTQRDPNGGQLINPASVTILYKDEQGSQLQTPVQYTGVRSSTGEYLTNYSITASGVLSPLNPYTPTPQEASELAAGFAQYYRSGQTKTFTPPSIPGYTAPTAKTVTFKPGENILTFTYHKKGSPTVAVNGDKAITKTPTIPSRPTFSGVATPGAIVVVTVHSDPVTCTTTADASGKWSCTLPEGLPAGRHTVYVEITNPDDSVQKLGPYSVIVKAGGGATVLAPDSGVASLQETIVNWPLITLVFIGLSATLYFAKARKARY